MPKADTASRKRCRSCDTTVAKRISTPYRDTSFPWPQSVARDAVAETLQAVTKLKGAVPLVAPGSLPNDGKVIADERPVILA